MGLGDLIFGVAYIAAALLLSVSAVLGFAGFLQAERSIGRWIVPLIIPLVMLGITLGTLMSGRVLTYASFDIENINAAGEGAGSWVLRIISFSLVGLGAAKVIGYLLRPSPSKADDSSLLFKAFIAYFIANAVLNSALGSHPAFMHNTMYSIVLFSAVYLARNESIVSTIDLAKLALLAMIGLSLATAIVKPELAVQPNYKGWIPGLSIRLWGLGSSPNSIGPLALLLLLLEGLQPFGKLWLRAATVFGAILVFFLAQSKTVWAAAIVAILIVYWYRHRRADAGGISIAAALVIVILLAAGTLGLAFIDLERLWHKLTFTQAGSDLTTLTGRSQIWLVALDAWRANPLFGYGPSAWGIEHRQQIGMPFAFSAHNQLLQSLSVAGSLGGITLLFYVFLLGAGAVRAARWTGGISLALFATLIFRCATEAPLAFGTILNGDFLTHLLLFAIALRPGAAKLSASKPLSLQKGRPGRPIFQ